MSSRFAHSHGQIHLPDIRLAIWPRRRQNPPVIDGDTALAVTGFISRDNLGRTFIDTTDAMSRATSMILRGARLQPRRLGHRSRPPA
jgi:hypothetical protein